MTTFNQRNADVSVRIPKGWQTQSRWNWLSPLLPPFSPSSSPSFPSAITLFLLLFTAASLLAAETPRRGGTLRLAVEADPHSLDAAQVFSNEEAMLAFFIFNTLLEPGPDGGFIPALAESLPTTSADGLTHTFHLRRGVRFSNGRELVADDVVYSFERFFDPKAGTANSSYFYSIAGGLAFTEARKKEASSPKEAVRRKDGRWIEPLTVSGLRALDRYTVKIQLNQPDLSFLQLLTSPPGCIVPRSEVEKLGRQFANHPVGTGRFMLKELKRGARIRLVRNPYHFRNDWPGPEEVDVLVSVDRSTQAMMFERGELDFQHYIHDPDFIRFKRDPKLQPLIRTVIGSSPTFIFLNCELPPFTNRLVRLALNHAVDKQALIKVLANRGVPGRGPVPLAVRGFNRDLPQYGYNPAKARALLAEAGFPKGFETTLWANRDAPNWMKMALFVQESLRQIGVTAHLKVVSYPALLEASGRRRTVPMGTWDWVSAYDDPKDTLDSLLNGDNITDEACMNPSFYADPRVQQLFREAVAEGDMKRRLEIYRQIEAQVVEDVPWIFLVQLNIEMMCQPWLRGLTPRGFWPPARLENCWLER